MQQRVLSSGYYGVKGELEQLVHDLYWLLWPFTIFPLNFVIAVPVRVLKGDYARRRTSRFGFVRSLGRGLKWLHLWIAVPARFDLYMKAHPWIWHPNQLLPFESGHSAIRADPRVQRDPRDSVPENVWNQVFARDDGRCVVCGASHRKVPLDPDHIVPVSRGGQHEAANLRVLCRNCLDLLLRVNAEESHHGISGRSKRPVGFKTHTFQASSAGFQHRLGCLVARSKRPHP